MSNEGQAKQEIRALNDDETRRFPPAAAGRFVIVSCGEEPERRMLQCEQDGREMLFDTDGFLSFNSRAASWLPPGWNLDVAPVGWTSAHIEQWFEYAIAAAPRVTDADYLPNHAATPRNLVYHGHLVLQHLGVKYLVTPWTKMTQSECTDELKAMLAALRQTCSPIKPEADAGDLRRGLSDRGHFNANVGELRSSLQLTHDERQKSFAECVAIVKRFTTAPPRGQNVVLPAPEQRDLSEMAWEFFRRDPDNSAVQAVAGAKSLCLCVRDVVGTLSLPPDRAPFEPNSLDTDSRVVGAIRNLWDAIPAGRIELEAWGEEITDARRFRRFRCVLGDFATATHAVQQLAEMVLEELWRIGQVASPPFGPPYASEDLPFEWRGHLPPFRVDWWYSVLPTLRRECSDLGTRFAIDPERPGRWDAGLEQELVRVKRGWRPKTTVDAGLLKTCHERAIWCRAVTWCIHTWARFPEQEHQPFPVDVEAFEAWERLCRTNVAHFQWELQAFTNLYEADPQFGKFTGGNAHLICFDISRSVLGVLWEAVDPEGFKRRLTDTSVRIDLDRLAGSWPAIRTALLAFDLPDSKGIDTAMQEEYAQVTTDGRKPKARTETPVPQQPAKRRTGRPKTAEKDSAAKVIAALNAHHDYDAGSVMNFEPAKNRQLANDFKVLDLAKNALTRFLADKFEKGGYKKYRAACVKKTIGALLRAWNGETPERRAELHDEEEEEDTKKRGQRRAGRAPGSHREDDE
jgi:hypothetical protein